MNSLRIEGQKTISFELVEQFNWGGAGCGDSSWWKLGECQCYWAWV